MKKKKKKKVVDPSGEGIIMNWEREGGRDHFDLHKLIIFMYVGKEITK